MPAFFFAANELRHSLCEGKVIPEQDAHQHGQTEDVQNWCDGALPKYVLMRLESQGDPNLQQKPANDTLVPAFARRPRLQGPLATQQRLRDPLRPCIRARSPVAKCSSAGTNGWCSRCKTLPISAPGTTSANVPRFDGVHFPGHFARLHAPKTRHIRGNDGNNSPLALPSPTAPLLFPAAGSLTGRFDLTPERQWSAFSSPTITS